MNIEEQKNLWNNPNNWSNDGNEWSIYFGTTENLWNKIYPKFKDYITGNVLEIAPGFGRMTEYLLRYTNDLSIIDLNDICIEKCKQRFDNRINNYIVNDGKTLNFDDKSFDFIFSFDSFVHMTEDVIESYISEIYRTLKNNGYVFIHHSFFIGGDNNNVSENIAGRSNMTPEIFKNIVEKYKMIVISQENFRISDQINDTITIFKK
jgi:ubiquinone/menaquinone biosynthesis C-methylase UbiE